LYQAEHSIITAHIQKAISTMFYCADHRNFHPISVHVLSLHHYDCLADWHIDGGWYYWHWACLLQNKDLQIKSQTDSFFKSDAQTFIQNLIAFNFIHFDCFILLTILTTSKYWNVWETYAASR